MNALHRNAKGFTLIELMIAMVLSVMASAVIYSAYRSQVGSYRNQEEAVDMQQNIRSAMFYMPQSIRMCGLDPLRTGLMGFVTNFDDPYNSLGATTDATHIAFALDNDEDGVLDINDSELVAYRLDNVNDTLQKLMFEPGTPPPASWETVAENIDALDFVYLDENGNITADLARIRSVQITLVVRAGDVPPPLANKTTDNTIYGNQQGMVIFNPGGDNLRRISLTAQVNCRNIGL